MDEFVLEMHDICKSFPGVKALDNAQLLLRPGTVHSLMGENGAGKSTLMKCLFGVYIRDEGHIYYEGQDVKFTNTKNALENGIAMVQQELNQATKRTVMENVWMGRYPQKYGFVVDLKKMYKDTLALFENLGINVDPKAIMSTLSVADRQMVEIAKAVSYNSKVIVFDEPTGSLADKEIDHLFKIINDLRARGTGIIYISHKMDEIFRISDEVTIMRDGKWVNTSKIEDITMEEIIKLMVGRDLGDRYPAKTNTVGDVSLRVENLTGMYKPFCKDVTFEARKGEVLGFAGLVGAGRTETFETIFGVRTKLTGNIYLDGQQIKINSPKDAIKNGLALLTEERRATGIFGQRDIMENATITSLDNYKVCGAISNKKRKDVTKWVIDSMAVKTPSMQTKIKTLSGGNQQKVIIGRWLLNNPEVLFLDEPTRGIDVGAKYEIYKLINDLACQGKTVIVCSSEMPELLGICDRIIVMSGGQIAGEVNPKTTTQEEIMTLAAKYV